MTDKVEKSTKQTLEFAHLDFDRIQRRGVGEVIFGEGKSAQEITLIMQQFIRAHGQVLATRVSASCFQEIKEFLFSKAFLINRPNLAIIRLSDMRILHFCSFSKFKKSGKKCSHD